MPDNNGNYTLPPGYLATPGGVIRTSQHNPIFEDVRDAMNRRLMTTGDNPMTGDLPMGGNKITGLADPAAAQDGATKAYVDGEIGALGTAATKDHGTGAGEVPLNSDLGSMAFQPVAVLTGMVAMFAGSNAPTGWLKANGATVSRTTYADLFSVIGTTFGAGDGSTTFALPDLRGEFVRGWDDGRGIDSGRVFGSAQGEQIPDLYARIDPNGVYVKFSRITGVPTWSYNRGDDDTTRAISGSTSAGVEVLRHGGAETRPRNIALLACIKY